ncbi:MAG: nuclear transport factor 2 family protein [Nitrospira sp.]|nr:nuclear transport factor 2 family protein [Nitrospira sp.]
MPDFSRIVSFVLSGYLFLTASPGLAQDHAGPESVIRALVDANAARDLDGMSRLMAHDDDATGYTIGGRKYVGWPELERDIRDEFAFVEKLEMPITDLKVWTKDDLAWFAMELDYIRYVNEGGQLHHTVIPLRESGVLEKRQGRWLLVSWHESLRAANWPAVAHAQPAAPVPHLVADPGVLRAPAADLSGEWEILEVEDDKRYKATLDKSGNGPYTQHGGHFTTTKFADRVWQGTWQQPGNDREGGFDLLLSEDGTQAKGVWWYSRVGTHKNIPPREHGGSYQWKRLTPPASHQ